MLNIKTKFVVVLIFGGVLAGMAVFRCNSDQNANPPADPTSASTLLGSTDSARSKKLRACATLSGVRPLLSHAIP